MPEGGGATPTGVKRRTSRVRPLTQPTPHVPIGPVAAVRAFLLVLRPELRETVVDEFGFLYDRVLVQAGVGFPEDGRLHRPVGRPELFEAVLFLHVLGDLEAAQGLDLPLWRAGPDCVRAPAHVVGAQTAD